ncbi:hypothetical protein [Gimesia sp.]|uniref:hypothetical protein n=1 Tax=Gimesia sp. TaxID=2024833 RepID=UPI003A930E7B
MLKYKNDGQDIVETNYWKSEWNDQQMIYASCNAGAVRLLLPISLADAILAETKNASHVRIKRNASFVEFEFEDGQPSTYRLVLSNGSFDLLPGDPGDRKWIVSAWTMKSSKPYKASEWSSEWQDRR